MKLHWSPRSPFVRKVMIVAHERGLVARIACVRAFREVNVSPSMANAPRGRAKSIRRPPEVPR